ncbi:spore germination protein [Microaerobacter geothermalis]|uniref:GerAB/ArcD/ProY family transporter n=1 Tax=Microaerobacter geothermalis TaxID=674972 RepID=UPI001F2A2996|nr:endospore germination permease [Microaerobacter geothermalis]MCF6094968.1 spore germination protein [Microaerobacter geothermalis]
MLENGKIGVSQFKILTLIFTIGSSILVAPSGLAEQAKQDAWIAAIIGLGIGLLFVWLYIKLGTIYPELTLIEYNEMILGKWLGKTVSLLFISYFFILASLLLREIGDFLTTQIMPETPIQAIQIIFAMIVMMGARLGLETITRSAEILFPWVIGLFLLLTFFVSPQLEFLKIQPVLEGGFKPILKAAFPFLGLPFLELVVFLMIFPYVDNIKKAGKAFLIGTSLGAVVIVTVVMMSILVLGVDITARHYYPSYALAKKINIGDFLQRVEAIMAALWFITIYFKLTICFYASVLGLSQVLKLKVYRPLILPSGMILVMLSLVASPNIIYFQTFVSKIWTPYSLTYGLFLPILLLIIGKWRGQW